MTQRNSNTKAQAGCEVQRSNQTVQPIPKMGPMKRNLCKGLEELSNQLLSASGRTYSYVVRSVKIKTDSTDFEQRGSAPNFQGEFLTLCTCKHQMRASQNTDGWKGTWVAGFTGSTIHDKKNWLFYLAQIGLAFDSHCDLWEGLDKKSREAKAAHLNYLGDVFMPKLPHPVDHAKFLPNRYRMPTVHSHRLKSNPDGWKNDINYVHAKKYRQPALLVGDPNLTFIWERPTIYLAGKHCRNYAKWSSVGELLSELKQDKS